MYPALEYMVQKRLLKNVESSKKNWKDRPGNQIFHYEAWKA